MSTTWLTLYVLAWPAIVAIVLAVIARGFIAEWIASKREGRDLI